MAKGKEQGSRAAEQQDNTIRMVRDSEEEPKTADVHPNEVENYKLGGWTVDKAEG